MNRHLATVHQLKPSKSETTNTAQLKLPFKSERRETFEEELAKMAAVDGFSFHQIATSSFVQKSLLRFYDKTLTSPTAIKDAVLSYHQKKQAELAKEMLAQPDTRFAAAFDEWTSVAGKRYLTITLFSHKDCYNLGMIPVKDSANAKNIKMLISKKASILRPHT